MKSANSRRRRSCSSANSRRRRSCSCKCSWLEVLASILTSPVCATARFGRYVFQMTGDTTCHLLCSVVPFTQAAGVMPKTSTGSSGVGILLFWSAMSPVCFRSLAHLAGHMTQENARILKRWCWSLQALHYFCHWAALNRETLQPNDALHCRNLHLIAFMVAYHGA